MIFNLGDAQKNLERARKFYAEGKVERAIKTLERSLVGGKNDFPLYLELGKYHFEINKFIECATNLKRAYRLAPEKWEEIIETIESAHFAGGTPEETAILLIEIYLYKDMFEDARKIIDASTTEQIKEMSERYITIYNNVISKKNIENYTQKDILQILSLSLLKQKIDLKSGLELYEMIFLSFPEKKEIILNDLEKVCRVNYGNPYPRFLKGKLLFKNKKYNEGIKYIERAVDFDKKYIKESIEVIEDIIKEEKIPILLLYLSKHQIALGKIDKAIAYAKEMESQKDIDPREIMKIYSEIIRKDSKNLDVRLYLAKLYAQEGKYDPVLSELSNIIEMNPEKFDEVTRIAEEIIEKDPYNSNLLYFLSNLYSEKGETDKAINAFEKLFTSNKEFSSEIMGKLNKVLEIDLENVHGLNLLAEIYAYKKKFEESLFLYGHLMDLNGGFDLAEKGIRKITEEQPDLIKAKIALGLAAFKKGNHKESLDIINSVVESDPEKVTQLIPQLDSIARKSEELAPYVLQVYDAIPSEILDPFILSFAKAEALSLSGDYKNAVLHYSNCFEIKPEQVDKIISGYQRILEKKEDLPDANFALGTIYLKTERTTEGLKYFRRASELEPNLSDEVIHILYELNKKYPTEPTITIELLKALQNKGAYEQVISECEDAIETLPKDKTGHVYLIHGNASLEKGLLKQASLSIIHALDIDETLAKNALELLQRAHEMDKNNVVIKYALAKACIADKNYGKASFYFYDITKTDPSKIGKVVDELKKIVNLDRVNPDAHFVLGSLYLTEKRLKDAIKEFQATSQLSDSYIDKVIGKFHYIEKHKPVPEVHLNLGKLYAKKRMFTKATHHLMEAYRKDENLAEQAVSYLNKIKEEDPRNISILYSLAELSEKDGGLKTTIDFYDRILSSAPDELHTVIRKVEDLLKEHKEDFEPFIFLSKLLSLEGKTEESIKILKEISNEYPDQLPAIMVQLKEMSDRGEDEASFSFLEYSLENNKFDDAIPLLQKIERNFSFHNRIIDLLEKHLVRAPDNPELFLYFTRFSYLKGEWDAMKEVISRALPYIKGKAAKILSIYNFLLLSQEGKDTEKLENKLLEEMGKKKFYFFLNNLEKKKKEFQLRRVRFARDKSPEVSSLIFEEAELLICLDMKDEAIKLLGEPFKNKKDRSMARYLTAKSFLLKNNPVRAIEILRTISLPHDKEFKNNLLLLLSSSYEKIGDYKSALISLKNCEPDIHIEKRISYLNEISIHSDIKGRYPIISG
ncbi:hypothetical protein KAX75_02635 [candidate division WOR-3 bacterium]|nr:hypothetical protein [candidate division WOR-3 bacterium]